MGTAAVVVLALLALVIFFKLWHVIWLVALTAVWIVALVDIVRRQFSDPAVKIIWFVVVFFTHIIGAIIYFVFGRSMGALSWNGSSSRRYF